MTNAVVASRLSMMMHGLKDNFEKLYLLSSWKSMFVLYLPYNPNFTSTYEDMASSNLMGM